MSGNRKCDSDQVYRVMVAEKKFLGYVAEINETERKLEGLREKLRSARLEYWQAIREEINVSKENATTNTATVNKVHTATQTIADNENVDHDQRKRRRIVQLSPLDDGASRFLDYMITGVVEDTQVYADGKEEEEDAGKA